MPPVPETVHRGSEVVIMAEKRKNQRATCNTKCILYHDGSKYIGTLENVSIGGALISNCNVTPGEMHAGNMCSLVICNNIELCPAGHSSMVVRLNSSGVGLQFISRSNAESA